jgi:hypothetical protein
MDVRIGQLVRIKEPLETTLGICDHGVVLSEFSYGQEGEELAWRVLCEDRTVILLEREFEVIT